MQKNKMRALVVDDDFINRMGLNSMVSTYFDVDMAANGLEALEAFKLANFQGNPYDLILLDIMMPVMDGQEALVEIRKIEKSIRRLPEEEVKIIMITALDTAKEVMQAYFKGGCTSYIVKPIEEMKLLDELKKTGINLS